MSDQKHKEVYTELMADVIQKYDRLFDDVDQDTLDIKKASAMGKFLNGKVSACVHDLNRERFSLQTRIAKKQK